MADALSQQSGSPLHATLSISRHHDGCAAALTGHKCDCPPPRLYVALDEILETLRDRQQRGASTGTVGWADRAADFIEGEFGEDNHA